MTDAEFAAAVQRLTPKPTEPALNGPGACPAAKPAQNRVAQPKPAQRSKYGAVRTADGYASKKEAKRAAELKLLEKAGKIKDLKEQVRFELVPPQKGERGVYYVADFCYLENPFNWHLVVEDVKGVKTDVFIIKRKLMLQVHGIRLRLT